VQEVRGLTPGTDGPKSSFHPFEVENEQQQLIKKMLCFVHCTVINIVHGACLCAVEDCIMIGRYSIAKVDLPSDLMSLVRFRAWLRVFLYL